MDQEQRCLECACFSDQATGEEGNEVSRVCFGCKTGCSFFAKAKSKRPRQKTPRSGSECSKLRKAVSFLRVFAFLKSPDISKYEFIKGVTLVIRETWNVFSWRLSGRGRLVQLMFFSC